MLLFLLTDHQPAVFVGEQGVKYRHLIQCFVISMTFQRSVLFISPSVISTYCFSVLGFNKSFLKGFLTDKAVGGWQLRILRPHDFKIIYIDI